MANSDDSFTEGRVQRKLRHMLEAEGYTNINLYAARGYYRTSKYADCYRWEGNAIAPDGGKHMLCSWESMTECVQGFTIESDGEPWEKIVVPRALVK